MTDYTKTVDFAAKDALLTGNPAKLVKGTEIDTEFNNIATAVATKLETNDAIGTPTSGTLTNCTGLPVSTGISGLGAGVATFLATPSSANLISAVTDETGTGSLVFATSPTLVTPLLGTPTSGVLTNCTGTASGLTAGGNALLAGNIAQAFSASNYTTAQGLTFPAVQNPSANVNTLDDYEEGTWTPAITFTTPGDLSVAYTNQLGFYTKIGHRVFIDIYVVTSTFTHTTASGNLSITGLPFAASVSTNQGCDILTNGIAKAGYTSFGFRTTAASTALILNTSGSGVTLSQITAAEMATGGAIQLRGQFSYIV